MTSYCDLWCCPVHPVSLNLSSRHIIESLLGAFLPRKPSQIAVVFGQVILLQNRPVMLIISGRKHLAAKSTEAGKKNVGTTTMINMENESLG